MHPSIAVVGLIVVAVVSSALLVRHGRRRREETMETWRRLARELGGRFEEPTGPWYRLRPFHLDAAVEAVERSLGGGLGPESRLSSQAELRLDYYVVSSGKHSVTYTRATVGVPTTHSLHIRREHALSGLGKLLGLQDVQVRDIEYDRSFMIKADDEGWLRAHLSRELRRLHLRHPKLALRLQDGEFTAVQTGLIGDRQALLAQLQVAALAARSLSA